MKHRRVAYDNTYIAWLVSFVSLLSNGALGRSQSATWPIWSLVKSFYQALSDFCPLGRADCSHWTTESIGKIQSQITGPVDHWNTKTPSASVNGGSRDVMLPFVHRQQTEARLHENKLLLYKTILRPMWTYGIPLWGTASQSNIEILQRFQNKALRTIVNAPWYLPNSALHADLLIPTVREEVTKHSNAHKDKLLQHPDQLIPFLLEEQGPKRLKRYHPTDLTNRFS
jgi:hypothetical protein